MTPHGRSDVYRLLLRLFPSDLRNDHGVEMERLFLAELSAARGLHRCRVWARGVGDALRHGLGMRIDTWRKWRSSRVHTEREPSRVMDSLLYDMRQAALKMLREPGAAAVIVGTFALATGANTAVFSAVNAALLTPLPYQDPERLVGLWEKREREGVMTNRVSAADYLDWARLSRSFTAITAFSEGALDMTGEGDPEEIAAASVSATYFDVFGIQALHGRTFIKGDDIQGAAPGVVLSHAFWLQRFGASPSAVGRSIILNGVPHRIVGVLGKAAASPIGEPRIFVPMILDAGPAPLARGVHYLDVYGRLKPGVSLDQARAEMDGIGKALEAEYPDVSSGHGANVTSLSGDVVRPVRQTLMVLMSAVGFVLLIACINVTNLLLARAAARRSEMAVRSAVGAARTRLARQVLIESGMLALVGTVAGLFIATIGGGLLAARMPAALRPVGPVLLSAPVLGFAVALCFVVALLAGALPAWHMAREQPAGALREAGRNPASLRRGLRFGLIVSEVAMTSLLLVGAGLTLRSFQEVLGQDPGIETDGRLTFQVAPPRLRYPDASATRRLFAEIESALAAEPSIRVVGATSSLPLTVADRRNGITIEGRELSATEGPTRAHLRAVSSGYARAIGLRLREGRPLALTDVTDGPGVAVINETMARRYWPAGSAVGRRFRVNSEENWREVVGVVGDVKHWGLDKAVNPEAYLPASQFAAGGMTFVVSTHGDPVMLAGTVQRHVREIDPNLAISQMRTMAEVAARAVESRRWTMALLGSFALVALALAAVGIFGVMSHLVSLRTAEIGIRMTLGANAASVMGEIVREALAQVLCGLALGLGASVGLMRGVRAFLFGVEPTDPLTLLAVTATLLAVSMLAVSMPAWRAMRVNPVSALKAC